MAAIIEHGTPLVLHPTPGFVVKTKIVEGKGDHLYHTKVFINICHDQQVPKPATDFDPAVVFPLIVDNQWEIPLIVSPEKRDLDKKGVPLFVYDCCMNSDCFAWIQINNDLKLIAVEWCIEAVELMHELVLERDYSVPKMLQKGELSATEITRDEVANGLQKRLQELKQNEQLGLLEALDPGNSGSDEELPDLMNIGGTKNRPLIEEISDMSIEDEGMARSEKLAEERPVIEPIPSIEPFRTLLSKLLQNTQPQPAQYVPYVFTITLCTRNNDFYLKFESEQLTPLLELSYGDQYLRITNVDPSRQLTSANRLEIPIPANAVPYQSFLVAKEQALYVFCHIS